MELIHVTSVLSVYQDFSKVNPDVLDYASDRGVRVHAAIPKILDDQWIPIQEDIKGYIASFEIFKREMIHRTVFCEKTFTCEIYRLTGTLDWGGFLVDHPDWFTIIDWKSPLNRQRTWFSQLAAYQYLAREYEPKRAGSLRLHPKGKLPKMDWADDYERAWDAYQHGLISYRYNMGIS